MNLMEETFKEEKNIGKSNNAKIIKIIIALIVVIILCICIVMAQMVYLEKKELKLFIDGKRNDELLSILEIQEDGTIYVPIKEIANYFPGYKGYTGDSSYPSEESGKCYIENEKEYVDFYLNEEKIYKKDKTKSKYESIYGKKNLKVKSIKGELYAPSDLIAKAFNAIFEYDQEKHRIYIQTLDFILENYKNKVEELGYVEIDKNLSNQRAVLEGFIIVKSSKEKYAVLNLEGEEVLESKYDYVEYLPNVGDFLVTSNNKKGIISKDRFTKLEIKYDNIEILDEQAKLFLVEKNNKYGAIDFGGNVKIFIEYDQIGIDENSFKSNNIKNKYLLVNNLIPVKKEKKWGMFDKEGNQIVNFEYDDFGYISATSEKIKDLLVIEEYSTIVAKKGNKYTLINSKGKDLFNGAIADDIYMVIERGNRNYYMRVNEKTFDVIKFLEKLPPDSKQEEIQKNNSAKEEIDKNNSAKEEIDKNNSAKEKIDKNNSAKEEIDKNNSKKEEIDKSNSKKEEIDKSNSEKEEIDKSDSAKEEMNKNNNKPEEIRK